ncbi:MAG: ABC transporter ATP-binding protein [Candidatus Binatia bacterium]|jgi:lipoprotein-releasing system ATP-binding protein
MSNLLSVRNLCKSFVEGGEEIHVLRGLDLELAAGERLAVIGESGVGKSTLLHILGTLDRPTAGQILYQGKEIPLNDEGELSHFRNREIGFVFQFHYLLPDFTALENVMFPALIQGASAQCAREEAEELLDKVGLKDRTHHRPGKLSGGEQQRVAVARAVILQPKLILADEPTGSLDLRIGEEVQELLFRLNKEKGIALIVATHNREFAERIGRRVELRGGRLVPALGSTREFALQK